MKDEKTHEVIPDALQKHDFINFYQNLSSPQFPWFLVNKSGNGLDLYHYFYNNFNFISNFSNDVKKILQTLNPEAIVEVYARLNSYKKFTKEIYNPAEFHTFILFINTNNSFYMINNSKIDSVANSMLIINPNVKYSYNIEVNDYPAALVAFRFFKKINTIN